MSEISAAVTSDAMAAKRLRIRKAINNMKRMDTAEVTSTHKTGSYHEETAQAFQQEEDIGIHDDGANDESEWKTHQAISLGEQDTYNTGIALSPTSVRSSSSCKTVIQGLTKEQSEYHIDHQREGQSTNNVEELALKVPERLVWEVHPFSASSINTSMMIPSATTQALTRGKEEHSRAILAVPPWYNSLYAGQELDYKARRRLKQHLRLPCFVLTKYGLVPATVLQDTGTSVSVMSRKLAKDFDAKIRRLKKGKKLSTAKGDLLVAREVAIIGLRLPCHPEKVWRTRFYIVDELSDFEAYLSVVDSLRMGHLLIAYCMRCARARSDR